MELKLKAVSSLEKVFADEELNAPVLKTASTLRGEVKLEILKLFKK